MPTYELEGTPPSVNHLYIHLKNGRKIMTKEGKDFKERVAKELKKQGTKKVSKPKKVMLTIRFYFNDKRRRDLDNCLKALQDALEGVLFDDDSQIFEMHLYKYNSSPSRRTILDVREMI